MVTDSQMDAMGPPYKQTRRCGLVEGDREFANWNIPIYRIMVF